MEGEREGEREGEKRKGQASKSEVPFVTKRHHQKAPKLTRSSSENSTRKLCVCVCVCVCVCMCARAEEQAKHQ